MGASGHRVIKFRGRHWIFYNDSDSFPEILGQWLVDSIPADPEQYQKWLQSQRDLFAKWDSLLNDLLTIQPEDMRKLLSGEPQEAVFHAAFDDRLKNNDPPYYKPGRCNNDIKFTYTIDLDREVFSVDNGAHFTLNKIPGTWMEPLHHDLLRHRFLLPQRVPAESVATLVLNPPSYTIPTHPNNLQTRLVKPKNADQPLPSYLTGIRLRWMLFDIIQDSLRSDLSVSLLSWHAQDLPFREIAFFILCLAGGGDHLALLDDRYIKKPYPGAFYLGILTNDSPETDIELATHLGVGYHLAGLPIGSAPEETRYWFDGALICLVPRLNCPGILEQAVADAVSYGRAQFTRSSFNAVLISIEDLVLIKSFPDGTVDHTEVLPLIHITSHLSKDAQARYGDRALETFYSEYYGIKKKKVKEPDESDLGQLNQKTDQLNNRDGSGNDNDQGSKIEEHSRRTWVHNDMVEAVKLGDGSDSEYTEEDEEGPSTSDEKNVHPVGHVIPPYPRISSRDASISSTFVALIQFFDATIRETLRPTRANEARLADEICDMVLHNVTDAKTYNACLKVSRRFRLVCQQRSLVMDNILFQDPLPSDEALLSIQEGENVEVLSDSQAPPDFLAVEVSSGRQMDVWLRAQDWCDDLTCYVVAGHESNRKTLVDVCINFIGLHVPLPDANEADKQNTSVLRYDKEAEMYGSEGTPWEIPFAMFKITFESETRRIGRFWDHALKRLNVPVDEPGGAEWTFPPNTRYYFGTAISYEKNGESRFFHHLYLRVKRFNKFSDSQWDEIIREATEHLNQTQEEDKDHCPEGGVVGGEEPYVILVIGLEARLFKWEQGFDDSVDEEARRQKSPSSALREFFSPGMVLNVCEKSDRYMIEWFLERAVEHMEVIKAKKMERWGGNRFWRSNWLAGPDERIITNYNNYGVLPG